MSEKQISIILPIYNVERYIGKCLDSLTGQTYRNIEIICVCDGSPDSSADIVRACMQKDDRIVLIEQENTGLSGARNTGIRNSHGEYIMFLDPDDWIDKETCEVSLGEAEKENADLVMWNYVREFDSSSQKKIIFSEERIVFDENTVRDVLHRRMAGISGSALSDPSSADSAVTAWGKLYRADVIKNNSCFFTDTKQIGTEDALFNLQTLCHVKRAVYIPEYFNHYRKDNDSSRTKKYKDRLYSQWQLLYDKMEQVIRENSLPFEKEMDNRIAMSIIGLGLTELLNPASHSVRIKNIRKFITSPRYKKAYSNLDFTYFPIHWKLFFFFCKKGQAFWVYLMIQAINFLIGK